MTIAHDIEQYEKYMKTHLANSLLLISSCQWILSEYLVQIQFSVMDSLDESMCIINSLDCLDVSATLNVN